MNTLVTPVTPVVTAVVMGMRLLHVGVVKSESGDALCYHCVWDVGDAGVLCLRVGPASAGHVHVEGRKDRSLGRMLHTDRLLMSGTLQTARAHLMGLWYSTLGGAYSCLGASSHEASRTAGEFALKLHLQATTMGNPVLASKCRLYYACSLIQQGDGRTAGAIVAKELDTLEARQNKAQLDAGLLALLETTLRNVAVLDTRASQDLTFTSTATNNGTPHPEAKPNPE